MSNPVPQVGDIYVNGVGLEATVKSVDLQDGFLTYVYSDGIVGGSSLTTFHSTFAPKLPTGAANIDLSKWADMINASVTTKCECGLDKTGGGGNHSDYCPKAVTNG